jgi:hypothetical protein
VESHSLNAPPPRLRRRLVAIGVLLALATAAFLLLRGERADDGIERVVQVPDTAHIRVEIINTTNQRGLARRAMFFLRDQGFDVVRYASGSTPRDSTEVVDRSGRREWAQLVAQALGVARVTPGVDSARFLDVTVYIGRDWRPPAKPFYP